MPPAIADRPPSMTASVPPRGSTHDMETRSAPDYSRKRAVPNSDPSESDSEGGHDAGRAHRGSIDVLDPPSALHGDTICLCAPAPKIPRPRNGELGVYSPVFCPAPYSAPSPASPMPSVPSASSPADAKSPAFILFRQHYQAFIAAENPSLSNPDISKIIGRMWQKQPKDTKAEWKDLADKEKARHRIQYPDYRYQPRRVSKAVLASADRLSLARFGEAGPSGEVSPGRCPKCGGRYIATPHTPSTPRLPLGSAKMQDTPITPVFSLFNPGNSKPAGRPATFEPDRAHRPDLASPPPSQCATMFPQSYSHEAARRPLPQRGRLPDDVPSDQKRRRYDLPPSAGFATSHSETPQQYMGQTTAPMHTPTSYQHSPPAWADLPRPQTPAQSQSQSQSRAGTRAHASSFSAGRPLEPTLPTRLSHQHPASTIPALPPTATLAIRRVGDGATRNYPAPLARLPPPGTSYGYYSQSASRENTPVPPSTGHKSQSGARPSMPLAMHSGIANDSLKLPPLQTHMLANAPSRASSPGRAVVPGLRKASTQAIDVESVSSGRSQDMRTFAVSPMPMSADGYPVRDSQASGIRAMVMSVPYLSKLEVLRRICPPQPAPSRRGPIISVEGHNAALVAEVSAILEKALARSGECDLGVWSAQALRDKTAKTETETETETTGTGKKDFVEDGPADVASGADSMAAYHRLVMAWRQQSQEIVQHIWPRVRDGPGSKPALAPTPASSSSATPQPETAKTGTPGALGEPGATSATAITPTEPSLLSGPPSPAAPPALATPSPDRSPRPPAALPPSPAALPPPPSPVAARLPVALITDGYNLSLSDHYAMTAPIDDGFPPIGHWEWMATLWRGTVGADLVVYADPRPLAKPLDNVVDTTAQEGIMIFHALPQAGGGKLVDDKASRRLAFEVMEWVRTAGFCEK